jgi:plastocyanin
VPPAALPFLPCALRRRTLSCALGLASLLAPWTVQAAGLAVQVTDARGAPLADAVAYAVPVAGGVPVASATATASAAIDQIDREFTPLVTVVQTGTRIRFPNKDNVAHDVYSFSPAKRFELKLYRDVPSQPVTFDKAGLAVLGCNIHDSMVAYVLIVDTPHFAKTDKAGQAIFDRLPPGEYRVAVWHRAMRRPENHPTQAARIAAGGPDLPPLRFALPTGDGR